MPEPKEETVAEVVAVLRDITPDDDERVNCRIDEVADRIEAAHAREIAEERAQGIGFCDEKDATIEALKAEVARLEEEIVGWVGYKRGIDEALNSGDGSYRP
jgi:hypothetical protein